MWPHSADGRLIATASEDGTSRIWSADTGQEIVSLAGERRQGGGEQFPSVSIESVAFSLAMDGESLRPARRRRAGMEVANGDGVQRLDGHTSAVRSASFSADGERVVTASEDGTAALWSTEGGHMVGDPLPVGHGLAARQASSAPDSSRVAVAGDDGTLIVWNVTSGRRRRSRFPPLTNDIHDSRRGFPVQTARLLVTANADSTAQLWTVDTSTPGEPLTGRCWPRERRRVF